LRSTESRLSRALADGAEKSKGSRSVPAGMRKERAFLVGLDYRAKRKKPKSPTSIAQAARDAASAPRQNSQPQFSAEESLGELRDLAVSAGAEIVGDILQHRDSPDPATLIGKGKLEEIAGAAASTSADLILFDHDLTASQQRNIEKLVNARVIDRTQLILDIFATHARTREGQLQVE
jgi:GTP-binding protein HflX